jgi:ABC-type oligopeptide transport system substrate-binding subunit/class 3 adenylate cyclase/ribosomal protein L40E
MQCPQCNAENPEGASFCLKCGGKLALVCVQCETELPPHAEFCFACGSRVAEPLDWARDRPPVAAPETMADRFQRLVGKEFAERLLATRGQVTRERRTVTLLFCDVKGSTAMAEKLDPEEWTEIMDGAFDFLVEPIARYEGTLARLLGDAMLVFFGAPIAHEDDPERACRAALEITAQARRYAEVLETERGIAGFNVRVGINTGLVVVGEVGSDLRVEYTAMGDAVNLAARMEAAAQPGTVLITGDTHKLVAPLFETEALGPIEVRGKTEPVSAYRLLAARAVATKPRGISGLASPLVGRGPELAALRGAVERLQAGVGGIVTIMGEAGIGKSRLVAEVRKQAVVGAQHAAPLQWAEGRCLSYGTSLTYLLWLDILRALLGMSPEDPPPEIRAALRQWVQALCPERFGDVYPFLARLMSLPVDEEDEALREAQGKTRLRDMEGEALKAGTFRAVEIAVRCAARRRPLAVLCEDLHWADPTSMELLEHLLPLTDRVPLLFVCVFRPDWERGSWQLKETASRLYRHRHTDLGLDPLSRAESATLVSNLLEVEGPRREPFGADQDRPIAGVLQILEKHVLRRAEGNPLYVEELLRSLIDEGAIVRQAVPGPPTARPEAAARWVATREATDIIIPDTLEGVLRARVDRLQDGPKRVLQLASVIGRTLVYRVLATVARDEEQLDAHLLTLQREELIRERARLPELEYVFKHELIREAAYNGLLRRERRVFHRKVAEALERLFPERIDEQVGLLAHHWERAGEPEKALHYLLIAGDGARGLYACQEAIDYYRRALALLKASGDRERAARTLMKLGLVYTAAFQPDRAQEAYSEAFKLWEPIRESRISAEPLVPAAVLRFAVEAPLTLDPGMVGDDCSAFLTSQLFEGLVRVDPEHNVLPALAARWEVHDGGTSYLFRLREGLSWSDGTLLTAADFEFAWKRNLTLASSSPLAHLLYVIKNARLFAEGDMNDPGRVGVAALDDLTLQVRLEGPTAYLAHLLAHAVAYPLPRWAVEGRRQPWTEPGNLVCNGAYQLEEWQPDDRLVLSKNPMYHGMFPGNAERVECPLFVDPRPMFEAYASDALDAISMINADPGTIAHARAEYGRELVFTPQPVILFLVFRCDDPPFDDARVRRAFVHAVNREALAREAWVGQYTPALGGFVPPGMAGHSTGIGLAYDPDRARRLLAEAGYPGGRGFPQITWLYSGGSADEPLVPFLQRSWRQSLGLHLQGQSLEWGAFMERRARDPAHLTLSGWLADYPDPDSLLRVLFHSAEGLNDARWHNARFDSLIEEAARVADQARRIELYQEADGILVRDEAAIMPLGYGQGRVLVKPWVTMPRVPPVQMRLKNIVLKRAES